MSNGLKTVFAEVAPTYERVNRILTLGLDSRWRRAAADAAAALGGSAWLDVCSGTGDMARELAVRALAGTRVAALDFCPPMLALAAARDPGRRILFALGNVRALPFPDASFDLITLSFATRNINLTPSVLVETFHEIRRVLKPGGALINLETSQPPLRAVRAVFRAYIAALVRPVGRLLSQSDAGYAYLSSTIPKFHDADSLRRVLLQAGFSRVSYRRLFLGAAAVHTSIR
jgi:demethylmenaquinone methyltransferase/2-methoxy-6-polyprenyl-1,4-benzoquinol methylase